MRFEHTAVVDGTPEEIFELTQDYARRLTWDPFLREAVLLGGATAPDVGVRAWCVARSGIGMETEYVSFQPPRVAAVKMTRGPKVLGAFAGTWELEPAAGGATSVTFRYSFRARPRWLAWLLEPLGRWWFSRETRLRVEALGREVRTKAGTMRATTAPVCLLAILGASVLLSGCGTLATAFDPKCGKLEPFSGTRASAQGHATQLDVPFSLVADVILLPITVPKAIFEKSREGEEEPDEGQCPSAPGGS